MKRLIVNADDFGFTRGVNAGIVRAFKEGILTSATMMANGEAFTEAIELARANPELGVGCHLSAVVGLPVAPSRDIASLVERDGQLPRTLTALMKKLVRGQVKVSDIECEFRAQVERVVQAGIKPTHLDSHKHSHTQPAVMQALARIAVEFGIPAIRNPFERVFALVRMGSAARTKRATYLKQYAMSAAVSLHARRFRQIIRTHGLQTPDCFFGVRLTGLLDAEAITRALARLPAGTTELMCHPAVYDDELERAGTRLKQSRARELDALIDPRVIRCIREQGVKLISFRELGEGHV